jgi:hypothetical protein
LLHASPACCHPYWLTGVSAAHGCTMQEGEAGVKWEHSMLECSSGVVQHLAMRRSSCCKLERQEVSAKHWRKRRTGGRRPVGAPMNAASMCQCSHPMLHSTCCAHGWLPQPGSAANMQAQPAGVARETHGLQQGVQYCSISQAAGVMQVGCRLLHLGAKTMKTAGRLLH